MNQTLLATGVAAGAVTQIQTGPTALAPPAAAIRIAAGDNIQSVVNGAAAGAAFVLEAGTHRMQSIVPKDGQQFYGQEGAILNGSRLLDGFQQDSGGWVIGGQTQEGERRILDEANAPRGGYPETVFIDDVPLRPVASLADLTTGTFYFDYAADQIHIADDPTGHKVEAGVTTFAFHGDAANVVVQNLVVEKYANPVQYGAIGGGAPEGWVVQNNEIRLNYAVGATVGTNSRVIGNNVHDNGQMGLGGNGNNIVVEGNEIASNGFFSGIDPLWEGGGTKFAETNGLVVRNNYSHDNNGYGLWTDIDNINTLYEGNRVDYNSQGGINHEISYDGVIRGNSFVGNGSDASGWLWGSAIQLQNSSNVDVYDNAIDLTGSGNAIGLIQQDRGSGAYGEYTTTGNSIHDNAMFSSSAASGSFGAVADSDVAGLISGGNTFNSNQYFVVDTVEDRWSWGDFYDWDGYRAASGQDADSTLVLVSEAAASARVDEPDAPTTPVTPVSPPAPVDTSPLEPAPVDPTPVDADPVDSDPVDSDADPADSSVAPVDSGSGSEADRVPEPVDAGPIDSVPADPDPIDSMPSMPRPADSQVAGTSGLELSGTRRGDHMEGGDSADVIDGRAGKDILLGFAGDDVLMGGRGKDWLEGGADNDVLMGGRGKDWLEGGAGDDTLSGGAGRDVFAFTLDFGDDTITDFVSSCGRNGDVLSFSRDLFGSKEDALAAAYQTDAGTKIDVGQNSVLLEGLKLRHLDLGDFDIV